MVPALRVEFCFYCLLSHISFVTGAADLKLARALKTLSLSIHIPLNPTNVDLLMYHGVIRHVFGGVGYQIAVRQDLGNQG